ncbi:MAG: hypothetical protein U5R48_00670 [Gammaproteobacteria bacterium]|nr:hypothetical protein [Gammaproteobacteria bacterium]
MPALGLDFDAGQLEYGRSPQYGTRKTAWSVPAGAGPPQPDLRWQSELDAQARAAVTSLPELRGASGRAGLPPRGAGPRADAHESENGAEPMTDSSEYADRDVVVTGGTGALGSCRWSAGSPEAGARVHVPCIDASELERFPWRDHDRVRVEHPAHLGRCGSRWVGIDHRRRLALGVHPHCRRVRLHAPGGREDERHRGTACAIRHALDLSRSAVRPRPRG